MLSRIVRGDQFSQPWRFASGLGVAFLVISITRSAIWAQESATTARNQIRVQEQVQNIEDSNGTEQTVPEIYPGESKDTGVQFILRAEPRKEFVQASVDSQYYYTSNAFYTEAPRTQTGVLVDTATVTFNYPTPFELWGGAVMPRVGFSYQWFNYGLDKTANELNNYDFDSETVFSEARWSNKDYSASIGLDWNRLLSHEGPSPDYTQFYAELTPHWSFERGFTINDQAHFVARYDGYIRITDVPDQGGLIPRRSNDRDEHSVTGALKYNILEHLDVQPYYQILFSDYTADPETRREDFLNTWGITFTYHLNDWTCVRLNGSYAKRFTNSIYYTDYEVFNAGVGVNMSFEY